VFLFRHSGRRGSTTDYLYNTLEFRHNACTPLVAAVGLLLCGRMIHAFRRADGLQREIRTNTLRVRKNEPGRTLRRYKPGPELRSVYANRATVFFSERIR